MKQILKRSGNLGELARTTDLNLFRQSVEFLHTDQLGTLRRLVLNCTKSNGSVFKKNLDRIDMGKLAIVDEEIDSRTTEWKMQKII